MVLPVVRQIMVIAGSPQFSIITVPLSCSEDPAGIPVLQPFYRLNYKECHT
jgi:hypothetical protein